MPGDRKHPKSVRRHRAAFDRAHRSAVSARRDDEEQRFPRRDVEKSTVFDLVYKYLSKCANKDMKWRQRNCACNKFNKRHARKKDIRDRDVATIHANLDEGISDDYVRRSRSRADKNMLLKRASRSSSRECIADYTKAVRDGRRRAKIYMREALTYGLQSGLLIPTDGRRNVLRVSRKLGSFSRNARKDNEDPSNIATSDTEYSEED
ncbi:PREDICTED: uncharacterized protein LOC105459834 [Wasmannia auropunctata]|uniref:uncharacterized protein LOC105459834 n=1 Tax=Wasmannia auropunctata TaxID=64793 RepID=UPI0005EDB5E8|nr:PREDICTED: uncharacterized protein LOC105459834 [Wasmannia auropunctata]